MEPDALEEACELNIDWIGSALLVNPDVENDPSLMERLAAVIWYMLHFRKFAERGWATLGQASRRLACSLSVGLEAYVEHTRGLAGVSD